MMSSKMDGIGQDLHNMEKEMEYYAGKLRQVEKQVEVSTMYDLSLTWIMWRSKQWNRNIYFFLWFQPFFIWWIRISCSTLEIIRYLRLHSWNCVGIVLILIVMMPPIFSLLDKYFMIMFGSIIFLRFHNWNCVSKFLCLLFCWQHFSIL